MRDFFFEELPNFENKYSNQTELDKISIEELIKTRESLKKTTFFDFLLKLFYFFIIGLPKLILIIIFIIIFGLIFILLFIFWKSLGKNYYFGQSLKLYWITFSRVLLFLFGIIKINFLGECNDDARFIVSNHLCFFDIFLFLPILPRILERKEILSLPLFKEFAELFGAIPVDRKNSCGLTLELIKFAEDSNNPKILLMPEGETNNGKFLFRFHLGAFLSDLPVQPVAIKYKLWGINSKISHISYLHENLLSFLNFLCIPFITINVKFLEIISLKSIKCGDPRIFADEVSFLIGNELGSKVINLNSKSLLKLKE